MRAKKRWGGVLQSACVPPITNLKLVCVRVVAQCPWTCHGSLQEAVAATRRILDHAILFYEQGVHIEPQGDR
ncbi:MAG: hypothetical protein ABSC94_22590 [Polyangiaceae bacterium]